MGDINFNNKNILVTGGGGFIGSNIARHIKDEFPKSNIVIFDKFNNSKEGHSLGHYQNILDLDADIICGDIAISEDLDLLKIYKFDYIFHQAAISDTRNYDQELVFKTNINPQRFFINKAKADGAKLIYASSAATYGNTLSPQIESVTSPENPYGYSKIAIDLMSMRFAKENLDTNIIGLRYFNVYGPYEEHKGGSASMILQLANQILRKKSPVLFHNSENIYRDFVYIKDVVKANMLAASSSKNGVYNVGSGKARSFKDIVDILQKLLSTNYDIEYIDNPYTGYQMNTEASLELIEKELGYTPDYVLEEGIMDYLDFIKLN